MRTADETKSCSLTRGQDGAAFGHMMTHVDRVCVARALLENSLDSNSPVCAWRGPADSRGSRNKSQQLSALTTQHAAAARCEQGEEIESEIEIV